jgi:hypothetical protein
MSAKAITPPTSKIKMLDGPELQFRMEYLRTNSEPNCGKLSSRYQMRKPFLSFGIIVAVMCASVQTLAQQEDTAERIPEPIAKVSFTLFHNRVYLPVEVNGRGPFEMVLDTGAAISGLDEANAQSIGLHDKGKAQLTGNGASRLKIAIAKNVAFRVGKAELEEKTVALVPFRELESYEGRAVAGVLGVNLFRRYIVEIDYFHKTLALYEPQTFAYHGPGEIVQLHFGDAAMFEATLEFEGGGSLQCTLGVDSGTYSALLFHRPYVQKHRVLLAGSGIDSFGFGIGGEFPEKLGRVGLLRIGALALKEPIAAFSDANSGATSKADYDGTIGGAVLSRFTVIFDYPHHKMILEPNSNFAEPFAADTSGLVLIAGTPNQETITVFHVLEKAPACEAGIKTGDIVLSVNGQAASILGVEGIRNLLVKPGVYNIHLRRGVQALDIVMTTTKSLY